MALDSRQEHEGASPEGENLGQSPRGRLVSSPRFIILGTLAVIAAVLVVGSVLTSRSPGPDQKAPQTADVKEPVKTGDPNVLAPAGEELKLVATPPVRTRAALNRDRLPAESKARISFAPYGKGPSGSLVLKIAEAEPGDKTAGSKELAKMIAKQNAIVRTTPKLQELVSSGGDYTGQLGLVAEGENLYLVLSSAEKLK